MWQDKFCKSASAKSNFKFKNYLFLIETLTAGHSGLILTGVKSVSTNVRCGNLMWMFRTNEGRVKRNARQGRMHGTRPQGKRQCGEVPQKLPFESQSEHRRCLRRRGLGCGNESELSSSAEAVDNRITFLCLSVTVDGCLVSIIFLAVSKKTQTNKTVDLVIGEG